MQQSRTTLRCRTPGRGLIDLTARIDNWLDTQPVGFGLLLVFVQHTSASLLIQENADPDVLTDLERFFARLVPDADSLFEHSAEGPDDMPAHVRAALTATQLTVPISDNRMALGTWQGVYLYEHRTRPHERRIILHCMGTSTDARAAR